MGTHPIFESDFDCLTDSKSNETGLSIGPFSFDSGLDNLVLDSIGPNGQVQSGPIKK